MIRRRAVLMSVLSLLVLLGAACRKPSAAEHVTRGTALFDQGRYDAAIIEFRIALQTDPKLGTARLQLGDAYVKVNNLKSALQEYVRASDLLPTVVAAH